MPRKSAAALATVTPLTDHRPSVPPDMPEVQQDLWRQIVGRMPHGWFKKEHLETLRAYCQHVTIAWTVARAVEQFRPEWMAEEGGLERLDRLSKVLDREHRMMVTLARTMRLTHQSQYDKTLAARQARQQGPTQWPWEVSEVRKTR